MRKVSKLIAKAIMLTLMLVMACGVAFAEGKPPMTPERAATVERIKKQKEQIPTHEKKKAAADSLKAERLKIYKAKKEAEAAENGQDLNRHNNGLHGGNR